MNRSHIWSFLVFICMGLDLFLISQGSHADLHIVLPTALTEAQQLNTMD